MEQRWYALWTKSNREKVICSLLEERGVVVFLPQIARRRRWSDRWKIIRYPLFPGYLFIHTTLSVDILSTIQCMSGVIKILGRDSQGYRSVPDESIESLQAFIEKEVRFEIVPYLPTGTSVVITNGPLAGIKGVVTQAGNQRLLVSIHLLNRSVSVNIDSYDVEPIERIFSHIS